MAKKNGELVIFEGGRSRLPTRDDLIATLETQRSMAVKDGAYAAANQAVALQAKLLGLVVDKHHVERIGSYGECRTIEEVEQQFAIEYGPEEAARLVGTYRRVTRQRGDG
jgi:hypothetical protein